MNRLRRSLIAAIAFSPLALRAQQAGDQGYTVLPNTLPVENPAKVEVAEFFWYGCIHCYNLRPRSGLGAAAGGRVFPPHPRSSASAGRWCRPLRLEGSACSASCTGRSRLDPQGPPERDNPAALASGWRSTARHQEVRRS
jgi:hypothetical protein